MQKASSVVCAGVDAAVCVGATGDQASDCQQAKDHNADRQQLRPASTVRRHFSESHAQLIVSSVAKRFRV